MHMELLSSLIFAGTWLASLYMLLHGRIAEVRKWKARYMVAMRQLKEMQEAYQPAHVDDIEELLSALGFENEKELLEEIEKLGIPKEAIDFALKHPEVIKPLIEKFLKPKQKNLEEFMNEAI